LGRKAGEIDLTWGPYSGIRGEENQNSVESALVQKIMKLHFGGFPKKKTLLHIFEGFPFPANFSPAKKEKGQFDQTSLLFRKKD